MSGSYDTIRTEVADGVATVSVARPDAMNAINVTVAEELATAVASFQDDDGIGAIVLRGVGEDAFLGGGDIRTFSEMSGMDWKGEFRTAMADLESAIEERPTPVIAAVDGVALGGGTEIAMMCDLIVAAESATFGQPEIGLGIIPGAGGTQRLTHLVGYLKAKELVLTGRHVPAAEAVDIGLANEVVPDEEFDDRVAALATELEAGSSTAQGLAKEAINGSRSDLDRGLKLEAGLAALAFDTADKEEGLAAFVERRDPEFGDD